MRLLLLLFSVGFCSAEKSHEEVLRFFGVKPPLSDQEIKDQTKWNRYSDEKLSIDTNEWLTIERSTKAWRGYYHWNIKSLHPSTALIRWFHFRIKEYSDPRPDDWTPLTGYYDYKGDGAKTSTENVKVGGADCVRWNSITIKPVSGEDGAVGFGKDVIPHHICSVKGGQRFHIIGMHFESMHTLELEPNDEGYGKLAKKVSTFNAWVQERLIKSLRFHKQ